MADVLDVESVELDEESELVVLADALAVLSVVKPSDESAEAMAAASGLTLFESDEASDAMGIPDIWPLFAVCPCAWEAAQVEYSEFELDSALIDMFNPPVNVRYGRCQTEMAGRATQSAQSYAVFRCGGRLCNWRKGFR